MADIFPRTIVYLTHFCRRKHSRMASHSTPQSLSICATWGALRSRSSNSRAAAAKKAGEYRLLNNRAYIGEAVHKGTSYPGEREAIIDCRTWEKVHAILTESPRARPEVPLAKADGVR